MVHGTETNTMNLIIQTLLKTSWEFSKLLLALLCHQLGELFILAQLKICLPSVPFYSSAGLMAHV